MKEIDPERKPFIALYNDASNGSIFSEGISNFVKRHDRVFQACFTTFLGVLLVVALLLLLGPNPYSATTFVYRLNQGEPIISLNINSDFEKNYATAWFPVFGTNPPEDLLAITVADNLNKNITQVPNIAVSSIDVFGDTFKLHSNISSSSVVLSHKKLEQEFGIMDPVVVFNEGNGVYYMYYTAIGFSNVDTIRSQLFLAVATEPSTNWETINKFIFKELTYDNINNPALLIQPDDRSDNYIFFACNTRNKGINYATSAPNTLSNFTVAMDGKELIQLISPRSGFFDSEIVQPVGIAHQLRDGNWLLLYNGAQLNENRKTKDDKYIWSIGFVILKGDDPVQVLQRSEEPLLSPELPWEKCILTPPFIPGQKNSVMATSLRRYTEDIDNAPDHFYMFYSGCQNSVGVASLSVVTPHSLSNIT